jgi:hypothetical protein
MRTPTRLLGLISSLCFLSIATAGVRQLPVKQYLQDPAAPPESLFYASAVAIDGDSIILVTDQEYRVG